MNVHCVGARRTALRQLHIAEAKAAVLATNQAIRIEEERKHQRESQYREEVYKWNGLFQGRVGDSLNSIRTAQQTVAQSKKNLTRFAPKNTATSLLLGTYLGQWRLGLSDRITGAKLRILSAHCQSYRFFPCKHLCPQ
ncbi:hypothetical protein [Avibacterium paragallinarum]|uniref:Uncharacterized protein n=1 Tax=Avibacterium paragallinarum TaxID=728 RepID=A0ABU7QRX6_AVIPA|nr:hypothetical protein [Avibacterium paragallinarum]